MSTIRILSNVGNAFFLAAGCWGDLLLIRVFLTFAYVCLLAIHFVKQSEDYEDYVWGFGCLYLHGSSAVRLFHDEGEVKMDEKKEQVGIIHQHTLTVVHANFVPLQPLCCSYSHHHFIHVCALFRRLYGATSTAEVAFLAFSSRAMLPSASSSLMQRQERPLILLHSSTSYSMDRLTLRRQSPVLPEITRS